MVTVIHQPKWDPLAPLGEGVGQGVSKYMELVLKQSIQKQKMAHVGKLYTELQGTDTPEEFRAKEAELFQVPGAIDSFQEMHSLNELYRQKFPAKDTTQTEVTLYDMGTGQERKFALPRGQLESINTPEGIKALTGSDQYTTTKPATRKEFINAASGETKWLPETTTPPPGFTTKEAFNAQEKLKADALANKRFEQQNEKIQKALEAQGEKFPPEYITKARAELSAEGIDAPSKKQVMGKIRETDQTDRASKILLSRLAGKLSDTGIAIFEDDTKAKTYDDALALVRGYVKDGMTGEQAALKAMKVAGEGVAKTKAAEDAASTKKNKLRSFAKEALIKEPKRKDEILKQYKELSGEDY